MHDERFALRHKTVESDLCAHFALALASTCQVRIARDKRKRRCRGYGFVRYRTAIQANQAAEAMPKFKIKECMHISDTCMLSLAALAIGRTGNV